MELKAAQELLNGLAVQKQNEADNYRLALSVLEDKFEPELTRLDNAETLVKLDGDQIAQLKADNEALFAAKTDLEAQVASLTPATIEPTPVELPAEKIAP